MKNSRKIIILIIFIFLLGLSGYSVWLETKINVNSNITGRNNNVDTLINTVENNILYFSPEKQGFILNKTLYKQNEEKNIAERLTRLKITDQDLLRLKLQTLGEVPDRMAIYSLAKAKNTEIWFYTLVNYDNSLSKKADPIVYSYDVATEQVKNISVLMKSAVGKHFIYVWSVSDNGRRIALLPYPCDGCGRWPPDVLLVDTLDARKKYIAPSSFFSWTNENEYEFIPYKVVDPCKEGMGGVCYIEQDKTHLQKEKF